MVMHFSCLYLFERASQSVNHISLFTLSGHGTISMNPFGILWLILRFKHKKSTPHLYTPPTTHHPTVHPPAVVLVAHDVQKGLLLPREGRVRQILRRRRAPHREGELLVAARDALPLGLGVEAAREVGLGFT